MQEKICFMAEKEFMTDFDKIADTERRSRSNLLRKIIADYVNLKIGEKNATTNTAA